MFSCRAMKKAIAPYKSFIPKSEYVWYMITQDMQIWLLLDDSVTVCWQDSVWKKFTVLSVKESTSSDVGLTALISLKGKCENLVCCANSLFLDIASTIKKHSKTHNFTISTLIAFSLYIFKSKYYFSSEKSNSWIVHKTLLTCNIWKQII